MTSTYCLCGPLFLAVGVPRQGRKRFPRSAHVVPAVPIGPERWCCVAPSCGFSPVGAMRQETRHDAMCPRNAHADAVCITPETRGGAARAAHTLQRCHGTWHLTAGRSWASIARSLEVVQCWYTGKALAMAELPRLNGIIKALEEGDGALVGSAPAGGRHPTSRPGGYHGRCPV